MIKSVLSNSFGFDDQVAVIVPMHRHGIDTGWPEKRASSQLFDFAKIASQARDNESLVHLLALGDGETVGANRNGDYFSKAANQQYHPTFMKAHYFHNHVNKDPKKSFGRVVAAAHNGPMGRVELIVGIDEKKAADDLTELEKQGEFPVSMSCRVPYDECMVCGHKAKSRKEYCKHAAHMMGQIMANGKQACVRNDHPDFFDISKVFRGADRVAWTFRRLEKAASVGEPVVGGAELAELLGAADATVPVILSANSIGKSGTIAKVASLASDDLSKFRNALRASAVPAEKMAVLKSSSDIRATLTELGRVGVCLPAESFIDLCDLDKEASVAVEDVQDSVREILSRLPSDAGLLTRICKNGSYDVCTRQTSDKIARVASSLRADYGLHWEDAYDRIMSSVAARGLGETTLRKSASGSNPKADVIANEYVSYLASFADATKRHGNGHDGFVQNLTALRALV